MELIRIASNDISFVFLSQSRGIAAPEGRNFGNRNAQCIALIRMSGGAE